MRGQKEATEKSAAPRPAVRHEGRSTNLVLKVKVYVQSVRHMPVPLRLAPLRRLLLSCPSLHSSRLEPSSGAAAPSGVTMSTSAAAHSGATK